MDELTTTVITAVISGVFSIITVIASLFASHIAAKAEVRKLTLTFQHEDQVSSDQEYAEMVKLVIQYSSGISTGPYEALTALGALRVKESGELSKVLDELYLTVRSGDFTNLDEQLDLLISVRRMHSDNCSRRKCPFRK